MSTQIQLQIQDVIEQIVQIGRAEEHLKVTSQELDKAKNELVVLDRKLRQELREIEQLEGLSTKAMFYKILGSKEEQLEKERQEYLELSLKEEDVKKSIQLFEYEMNLLRGKTASAPNLKKELEFLKHKREEEIIKSVPSLRKELLQISNELETSYQYKSELEEATEVGTLCKNLTHQIITELSMVKNWGHWPPGRRGRRRRSNKRRDAIDRARNLAFQVKHHLNLFEKELADIGKQITFNSDTSKFTQFSDFFFNNLITDWIMQQQLSQAIGSANLLFRHLEDCLEELKLKIQRTASQLASLNDRRDKILVS